MSMPVGLLMIAFSRNSLAKVAWAEREDSPWCSNLGVRISLLRQLIDDVDTASLCGVVDAANIGRDGAVDVAVVGIVV
jgi:hypothetical protein